MEPNLVISEQLKKLGLYYENKGELYRRTAFLNASHIIAQMKIPITNVDTDLKGIAGIGSGIKSRIKEFLETGKNKELESERGAERGTERGTERETERGTERETKVKTPPEQEIIEELTTSYGIGRQTARRLVHEGITGLNDLIRKYNRGEVKLTHSQIIGLRYYQDFNRRIPREEISRIGKIIYNEINQEGLIFEIVGSYRRRKETSGDIDILISHPRCNPLWDIIKHLEKIGFIVCTLSHGGVKFQGVYNSSYGQGETKGIMRKIDIRYVPYTSWIPALIHATGSDLFNRNIRIKAIEKGMTLSEHGLYRVSPLGYKEEEIPLEREEDLFTILGLEYIPPENR